MNQTSKILIFVFTFITIKSYSQTGIPELEKPFIEVAGMAEKEVIPDEIFISISIKEKYVDREKLTVEKQEEKLKKALVEAGIDIVNLSLTDANADYVKVRWQTKDVITKKEYTLKVANATMVGDVFKLLDKLEINDATISKVSYSKIDSLRKDIRIQAIKNAKEKADYLLAAIGEKTGKPIVITENQNSTVTRNEFMKLASRSVSNVSSINSNNYYYNSQNTSSSDKAETKIPEIEFRKIKVEHAFYVKFEIK